VEPNTTLTIRLTSPEMRAWLDTESAAAHRTVNAQINYLLSLARQFGDIRTRLEKACRTQPALTVCDFLTQLDGEQD